MSLEPEAATPVEEFNAAFADLTAPKEEKKEEPAAVVEGGADGESKTDADGAGAVTADAVDAEVVEAEPAQAEAAPAAEETQAEPSEGVADAVAKEKSDDPEAIIKRLAEIVREQPAKEEKPAAVEVVEDKKEETPLYNDDERAFLTEYEKDWGDVSRAEALKRREFGQELLQYAFSEIAKYINPIKETVETLATRTHYADLEQAIGKYDDKFRDEVEGWVKTQPSYLQTAYMQVINQGTAEEVKDLVDRFRKETGKAATAAEPAKTESKKVTELSTEAKKAAEALAPVSTKRSGVQAQDDPSDFDSAWARFTSKT